MSLTEFCRELFHRRTHLSFLILMIRLSLLRQSSGPLDQLTLTALLLAEFKVGIGEDPEECA